MTAALALGAVFGLAMVAAWRCWRPPLLPLTVALERLAGRDRVVSPRAPGASPAVGRWLRAAAASVGLDLAGPLADLRIAGRDAEAHLGFRALLGLAGFLVPPVWAGPAALLGVDVSVAGVSAAALLLAAAGVTLPGLRLKAHAAACRRDFAAAVGSFVDLVVVGLAGGSGIEGALMDAARVGQGWASAELRHALEAARLSAQSPWAALSRLGEELGVPELTELAASVSLAGTEGARVRASLAAKTAALRTRQLADAEAQAQAATERLAIPTVLMMTGFVILIGYPALDAVVSGL